MSTHSRRQLIGGTASLFLLAPAAAGAAKALELDGPLIAAAAEYAQLEDEYCVVCSGVDQMPKGPERTAREARMDAICEQQDDLFEAMCDMPARTRKASGQRLWRCAARSATATAKRTGRSTARTG